MYFFCFNKSNLSSLIFLKKLRILALFTYTNSKFLDFSLKFTSFCKIPCFLINKDIFVSLFPYNKFTCEFVLFVQRSDNLSIVYLYKIIQLNKNSIFLAIDNVQDSYNIGSCIRSAVAANVSAVIISGFSACGLTERVVLTSCGAINYVPVIQITEIHNILWFFRFNNILIRGVVVDAKEHLYKEDFTTAGSLFIFGSENSGLKKIIEKICDRVFTIPMFGTINSLSIACAVSIVLFEAIRQRNFLKM